ncbi:MAG: lipopolysaccharide biosynthesis protein [Oleiphilus sp.]|nr:MAG: lipopolysaccharide biosynthesis protein [Oleiphilus sp.]
MEHNDEHSGIDLERLRQAFGRRKKTFAITLLACLIMTVLAVVLIPASYQSKSTILIEQQEIPQELVRSTVTSYADQRIETITQRVMTSSNLWKIVEKYDLYIDERRRETREYIINEMREEAIQRNVISAEVVDPRSGRPTEATIAFQLSFEYESPMLAQRVTNELTTLFLSENLKSRTQMAEQASSFLTSEAEKLDATVARLEQELATFKEEHFDSLPELTDLNLRLLDRTEQALRENQLSMNGVKERMIYLESELAQIDPHRPVIMADGQGLLSSRTRLKAAKQQFEQAGARYSAEHPSVLQLRSEIEGLLAEVPDSEAPKLKLDIYTRQLAELRQRYSDAHPSVQQLQARIAKLRVMAEAAGDSEAAIGADNPAYVQIKAQKEAAMLELDNLRAQRTLLRDDLARYEARITQAPKIEQRYQQLQRDYQSAVLKYAEVKAKQQEANLGRSLESEQKGERFTLIEPPLIPEEPHSPNRKLLAVLGVLLSLGLSVGLVMVKEMLDKSIRGRKELVKAIGAAPLAVIPIIATPHDLSLKRKQIWLLSAGLVLAIVASLTIFHLFIKPLDVTWYIALRKLGVM